MIKVVIIGSGNVAIQLSKVLNASDGVTIAQRYSRNNKHAKYFDSDIDFTQNLDHLAQADIYIIAVSDDAIHAVSKQLNHLEGLVVHTSGTMALNALQCQASKGVFYPLQSISKDKTIDFKSVPIAIETERNKDQDLLNNLAELISNNVFYLNSSQREQLHIAAVFANNFSNHMIYLANQICKEYQIDSKILQPLILETFEKLKHLDAYTAQTGPARRQDVKVTQTHLSKLKGMERQVYEIITDSILKHYN